MKRDIVGDPNRPDETMSVAAQYHRLPRLERMREVMRAQSIRAERTADTMAHIAEENWRLRRLLGELLRDTGFIAVLNQAAIKQIPSMLISRIVLATQDSGPLTELETGARAVAAAHEQAEQASRAPGNLPGRTSECLARMSCFRRRQVLALMHQTRCFSEDFALALLAVTPAKELILKNQRVERDQRYVASLARCENKLHIALRIIGLLGAEHPLMLVERTLHLAFGRLLLSQPAIRTWLEHRTPEYIDLLFKAGVSEGPRRASRRPIRVAR